jgi:SAM-dependent methyltransferase
MLHSMARFPGIALRVGREIGRRAREHGARSAWICARVHLRNAYLRLRNRFPPSDRVECPCCGWRGVGFRALDCGQFLVPEVECPHCRAHERHRFLHLYLSRRPPAFMNVPGRILHFAPEVSVRQFIDRNPDARCISTDYAKGVYAHILQGVQGPLFISDIHHMPLADGVIGGIFCLHVLEHVRDDREAIRNLYRITRPGGEAVLMVPFMMDQTATEEYGAPDPELFDHVRGYSPLDFKERLAPFDYEEIVPSAMLTADDVNRYKIPDSQVIYLCRKGGDPNA